MPLSRQQLIEALGRVAQGDQAAFAAVYAATSLKLYGIIVRILGRRDLADEVLQEVYVRVWQSAADYDPGTSSPITWLATIARNRALDEAKRKTMVSLEESCCKCPATTTPAPTSRKWRNDDDCMPASTN